MSPASGPTGTTGSSSPARGLGGPSWTVERRRGSVPELLDAPEPPPGTPRLARLHTVDRPGLVLGSTQPPSTADRAAAAAAGVDVVRRRSGGGAVLLWPGRQVWADFFVPADDPLWSDDVSEAALWAGEAWAAAIGPFAREAVSVHSGQLVADRWGRLVCFAGRGPGEVLVGGLKVAGVSQRRSRHRARIQTTARVASPSDGASAAEPGPSPDELDLLDLGPQDRDRGRAEVARRCGAVAASAEELTRALLEALPGATLEEPRR